MIRSNKAKEFIEKSLSDMEGGKLSKLALQIVLNSAVDLSEQELRGKAIEAYKRSCELFSNGICTYGVHDGCDNDCFFVTDFISLLDKT